MLNVYWYFLFSVYNHAASGQDKEALFRLGCGGPCLLAPDHAASKFTGGAFCNLARLYGGGDFG